MISKSRALKAVIRAYAQYVGRSAGIVPTDRHVAAVLYNTAKNLQAKKEKISRNQGLYGFTLVFAEISALPFLGKDESCACCLHFDAFAGAPDCGIAVGQCMHKAALDGGRSYWRSFERCSRFERR